MKTNIPELPPHWLPISAATLAEGAGVDHHARKAGVRGMPAVDEARLSDCETEIVEAVNGRVAGRSHDLQGEVTEIRNTLAAAPAADLAMATLNDDVINRIVSNLSPFTGAIRGTVRGAEEARAAHEAFILRHGHEEEQPSYADSKFWVYAVLIVIWLLETALGSSMYLGASKAGWLGAVGAAAAVSALNLLLGCLGGVIFRYVNLPALADDPNHRVRNQTWSIPALALVVVAVILVNGMAAHYREVASAAKTFTEAQVMAHAKSAPTDLSLWSIALFMLGCLCVLAAGWKMWGASTYPGYERVHRKMLEKTAEREDLKQAIQGGFDAIRTSEIDTLWSQRLAVDGLLENARRKVADLELKKRQALDLYTDDVAAGEQAISRFRRINESVRTDNVVPAYFKVVPAFRAAGVDLPDDFEMEIEKVRTAHLAKAGAVADVVARARQSVELAKALTEREMHKYARNEPGAQADGEFMNFRADLAEARLRLSSHGVAPKLEAAQ